MITTATEIYGWYKDFFDSNELHYTEEENDIITIQMPLECKLQKTLMLIACMDNHVCIKALSPLNAYEASRANVLEYLMRANFGMIDGSFEMDMSDGEISFKMTFICEDRTSLSEQLTAMTFMLPQVMLMRYGNGLIDVMFGAKTPEEAIAGIEDERDCSCGCDNDTNHDNELDHEELNNNADEVTDNVDDDEPNEDITDLDVIGGDLRKFLADIVNDDEADDDNEISDEASFNPKTMCLCDKEFDVIEVLNDTPDLRELCMQNSGIDDISVLANLSKLEAVWLSQNVISDLSPLTVLTNLKELKLSDNEINDLSPLAELINLKSLCVCNNQIDDISALAGLTALEGLCICFQQIEDISALEGMVNMRELHLEGNQIEDLSPLASMVNLQKLNMVGNNISDISPLYGLKNLKHLDLSDNDISEEQALEFSRRNPDCEFYLVSVTH